MQIKLTNTGKRYNREWIFRHCDYAFSPGKSYAITGANGSGKSTLLQVISGALLQSEGEIKYTNQSDTQKEIPGIEAYKHISFAAPYLELVEEMTASECLNFHARFKPLLKNTSVILKETGLHASAHKQIRYFSSGMKQRLRLAQAFFSYAPVLLLDEPLTNLDAEGIELYKHLITAYTSGKLVIVSSNDKQEYEFCEEIIGIGKFK